MKTYQVYLPVCDDSSRVEFPASVWQHVENCLLDFAGGFTLLGTVSGVWLDQYGNEIRDTSKVYSVATDNENKFRELAIMLGQELGQRCVYVLAVGQSEILSCQ